MYAAYLEYLNRQRIIPKLKQWTLGATIYMFSSFLSFCECICVCFVVWFCLYSFAFAICPRVLSVRVFFFLVFFFGIVFSACYHWWIWFLVWLLSSFFLFLLLFNFLIFNNYFNDFILFFLSFFLFFSLFFWAMWLTGSWCSSRVSGLCLWGGGAEFRTLVHQRPPGST